MTDPDQCIICLEPLAIQAPAVAAVDSSCCSILHVPATSTSSTTTTTRVQAGPDVAAAESPTTTTTAEDDAAILPDLNSKVAALDGCDHVIHESCIRLWAQKTNTCPICREPFRKLRVLDSLSGSTVECIEIDEKKQVADFDPQEWLAENTEGEAEEAAQPCPVCNSGEREDVLLLCDGCNAAYHTYCIGLEEVPSGNWFCMECADTLECSGGGETRRPNPRQQRTTVQPARSRPFPRTRERMRRARRQARSLEWAGPWGQFAGRVYDALQIDLDDNEDDDALAEFRVAQLRRERERQELQRWQQRIDIANRLGAGEVFANSLPMSARQQLRHVPESQPPPIEETRDERMAWGALELARKAADPNSPLGGRKRRAPSASPAEPSQEPERKLKRPRTRRFLPAQSESSGSKAAPVSTDKTMENASSSRPAEDQEPPSFLSSLLKEVGVGTPSDDENVKGYFARPPPDVTSPASSPSPSVHNSPRALSLTPPPLSNGRPSSPTLSLSSYIEPRYPRANYSPTRQGSSPTRQSPKDHSDTERSPEPQTINTRPLVIRQPRPRRPQLEDAARSMDASSARDQLSTEAKLSISGIVRTALKPHWHAKELSTEQYSAINRDVSRKLYEEIKNPSTLDGDTLKTWEKVASKEVAQAVAESKA